MKLRALIIAPCLDGEDVGEAWSSFQWVRGLSALCETTVLGYHKRGHKTLAEQLPGARVIEWRDLPLVGLHERLNSMAKPAYPIFRAKARRWIKRALGRGERFDVGHQLAPLAARYASPLAELGIPWILGPVAGGLSTPAGFGESAKTPWYLRLRGLDSLRAKWDPKLRRSYRDATEVVSVAPYMKDVLRDLRDGPQIYESETGVLHAAVLPQHRRPGPVRMLYVGRIIRTKGLLHGIRALGALRKQPWSLDVVGAGEEEQTCRAEVERLNLGQRVTFHGRVPREQVDAFYEDADLFLFPSYREPSGNVVIEAMSHGLCVVCCDRGGPGHVVQDGRGFKVPVLSPSDLEQCLAETLGRLLSDPALLAANGRAAHEFIAKHAVWSAKISRMHDLYQRVASPL